MAPDVLQLLGHRLEEAVGPRSAAKVVDGGVDADPTDPASSEEDFGLYVDETLLQTLLDNSFFSLNLTVLNFFLLLKWGGRAFEVKLLYYGWFFENYLYSRQYFVSIPSL